MAITYSISGGADAAKFNINATTGVLTFKTAPDYEKPGDNNADNIYEVQVKATDAGGASSTKDMQITVKDVSENLPPQITSAAAVAVNENQTAVTTVTATDPDDGGVTPPPSGDWPSEANTGPAAGISLTNSGSIEAKTDNAVIKNMRVNGAITVTAMNVTVQDCEVNASGAMYGIQVPDGIGQKNLKVIRCHVYGDGGPNRTASHVTGGVWGAKEVAFCNIHGCENAVVQGEPALYMHDNYIHDSANWPSVAGDHTDGLQTYGWAGSGGLRIEHNTIMAVETGGERTGSSTTYYCSSAIALSQDQHDLTINNNLLAGGTYTIYGNAQAGGSPANTKVTNNRFSTRYGAKVGQYGTSQGFASNTVWTGNVIHETGAPVNRA